ncbi:uncharacterized protein LOC114935743, partial [Nylanderia fulva]|uniref:uncharacterized protein LOC114935743 n=1 Tax=Nylanderia fulva TaxID=613905 RepID=UPI0010FAD27E
MDEHELMCGNYDTLSRLGNPSQTSSNIDLFFCTTELINIMEFSQVQDTWNSDHFPIVGRIRTRIIRYKKRSNRASTKRTKWKYFTGTLREYAEEEPEAIGKMSSNEIKITDKFKIFETILKKATLKISDKNPDNMDIENEGFNKHNDNTKNRGQPKEWWDQECKEWNKWINKNREEEINKDINILAPPYVLEEKKGRYAQEEKQDSQLNRKFKYEELTRALNMIRRNSAPGRDGIEYTMLKNLTEEMKNILLNMYNEVWFTGKIPDAWRKYQVVFIDKPGKEKVRPIALSSCIGKLMERLVNERLVWWAEHEGKLAGDQNGFRRGINSVQFADDIALYTTNINRNLNMDRLEEAVDTLANRLSELGLDLEPKKTVLVEFNKNGFRDKTLVLTLRT